jgi:hypothetical protein
MNWKTVYIVGKGKFYDDVMRHIDRSGLEVMSGYHARQSGEQHELFWIPETMTMREFKEGIGAKTIFKHRLRFFESLEQFIETINSTELTEDEKKKVERMRRMDLAAENAA